MGLRFGTRTRFIHNVRYGENQGHARRHDHGFTSPTSIPRVRCDGCHCVEPGTAPWRMCNAFASSVKCACPSAKEHEMNETKLHAVCDGKCCSMRKHSKLCGKNLFLYACPFNKRHVPVDLKLPLLINITCLRWGVCGFQVEDAKAVLTKFRMTGANRVRAEGCCGYMNLSMNQFSAATHTVRCCAKLKFPYSFYTTRY